MLRNIKLFPLLLLVIVAGIGGCKKEEYSFGDIKTPTNLTLTTAIKGVGVGNPNGDGSGIVTINASAENAIAYKIDYGTGMDSAVVANPNVNFTYRSPGTNSYTITINAIGTAGVISSISKTITVFVLFNIPADMLQAFTHGTSRTWISDSTAVGHFGVGSPGSFTPNLYAAPPNSRQACAYDDDITFTKDALNRITMSVNNKGESFSIGAAAAFYGFGGADACFAINASGNKLLTFMGASSGSTAAQSTQIQFIVPGNGIINFGTGGVAYEILEFSDTQIHIRNMGADGNSWYQKLKPKP